MRQSCRLFLIGVLAAVSAIAQPAREFETASVKPYAPTGPPYEACNSHSDPVQFGLVGCSLKRLIIQAYDIKDYQLQLKAASWVETDPYSIQARTTQPATKTEQMQMLQPLLASRFHVRVRWETRQEPVYLLTVASRGLKLQPATKRDHCGEVMFHPGTVKADCVSVDDVTEILESILTERPVVNQTGLGKDARYQIDLQYSAAADPSETASIFAALPDQLGLSMKVGKAPLKMVIVDRAERPEAN
jgi:uncharacterized protein (TIGR03435 family)